MNNSENKATAVLSVTILQTVNDLIGPAAFVSESTVHVNERTHFAFMAARYHSTMRYEIEYGDGERSTFDASGIISPIPDWAGAAAASVFGDDLQQCNGSVLEHVYKSVGEYTARVRVTAAERSTDELVLTATVSATVRQHTLSQMMSTARVYRLMASYHDEYAQMLFCVDEFPETLSLSVNFGDGGVSYVVRRMSGDGIPLWFNNGNSKDITVRTSTATVATVNVSCSDPFFGAEVGHQFAPPGTYDVRFVVSGTIPGAEAPQRALIVARVDVRQEKRLESQLAGSPLLFAQSPVFSGQTTEILVVVRRMIRGVRFTIDLGDGTRLQSLSTNVFRANDLPDWLRDGKFTSTEPFPLTSGAYYGCIVRHSFREPGFYPAMVMATVSTGGHCEEFTSLKTVVHVADPSNTPPLSELLGDDALVVLTPLLVDTGFQSFYLASHNVAGARYTFSFGDLTGLVEGRICTEWPHINSSNRTIAGRLTLDEARKGSAETAVCASHVYRKPGNYTVRVRVQAPPSGVSQRTWNLGGRVTVLPRPSILTTLVRTLSRIISRLHLFSVTLA